MEYGVLYEYSVLRRAKAVKLLVTPHLLMRKDVSGSSSARFISSGLHRRLAPGSCTKQALPLFRSQDRPRRIARDKIISREGEMREW